MENNRKLAAVPDKTTRPDGPNLFDKEILSNPAMRGQGTERLYKRRLIIGPEVDAGQEVYLGIVRLPENEAEAERVDCDLEQYGLITDDLFLDPETAKDAGLSLIMGADAIAMQGENKEPDFTVVLMVAITLPQGADPARIGSALHKSLDSILPKGSELSIKSFSKDMAPLNA